MKKDKKTGKYIVLEAQHVWHWEIAKRKGDICAACYDEMNKKERERMDALKDMGCIVCKREHGLYTYPEVHHLRDGRGMGHKKNHLDTIPLCAIHHRLGELGTGFHSGTRKWQQRHGEEQFLLEIVNNLLDGG